MQIPLDFRRPCMTHDFWVTEHYAIFLEGSLYMAPEDLFKGLSHTAFRFDPNKPTRIGIIPLNATDASVRFVVVRPTNNTCHMYLSP